MIKNKIREIEKEIRKTRSPYRKRDLYRHIKRLKKAEFLATKNDKKHTEKNKNLQQNF